MDRIDKFQTHLTLPNRILHLLHLDLTKPLNLEQVASRGRMDGSNSIVAIRLELGDVDCADAVGLDCVDVDDEPVLLCSTWVSMSSLGRK